MEPPKAPVMDVLPPTRPPEALATPPPQEPNLQVKPGDSGTKKPEPPKATAAKQPGNRATAAIVATVVIVLALGTLATYAFLKTR